jgi:hypothetical protein
MGFTSEGSAVCPSDTATNNAVWMIAPFTVCSLRRGSRRFHTESPWTRQFISAIGLQWSAKPQAISLTSPVTAHDDDGSRITGGCTPHSELIHFASVP